MNVQVSSNRFQSHWREPFLGTAVRRDRDASAINYLTHGAAMKSILCRIVSAGAMAAIVPVAACQEAGAEPPNIVFILVDDLGAGELGCYGNTKHRTPSIDRLAADGMRFDTCYTVPVCSPSRVLLLTGRYGFRTGWFNFTGRPGSPTHTDPTYDLGTAETTLADVLKSRGYATGLAGRWLEYGHEHQQIPRAGFDEHFVWAIWGDKLPPDVRHTGAWENRQLQVTAR